MSIKTINKWKKIMSNGNTKNLSSIIHKNATFFSPVVYSPQKGKKNVIKYLYSAIKVFEGKEFRYTCNEYYKNSSFFGEFFANLNGIEVNGVDIISCETELIKDFKVLLRPLKGLEAVWNEMKNKLDEYDYNLSQQ